MAAAVGVPALQTSQSAKSVGAESEVQQEESSYLPGAGEVETLAELNDRLGSSSHEVGRTKIGLASQQGNIRQVESFIFEGGSTNEPDEYGETPVHLAAAAGQMDMLRFLAEECRAEVNLPNWEGWTALFWAVVRGQVEAVKYLLSMGASIHAAAAEDWTALHFAAMNGDVEMVKILLEAGAEASDKNSFGLTAGDLAGNQDILQTLSDWVEAQEAARKTKPRGTKMRVRHV